jgi:hypothetical protein
MQMSAVDNIIEERKLLELIHSPFVSKMMRIYLWLLI